MKNEIDSRAKRTVKVVKEDVKEALKIERRKLNLVIHGVPESDAEQDIDQIAEILATGLHMDFERHVDKVMRIGKFDENKSRPIRLVIKTLDGKKQILSRAKDQKDVENYKRMFISPDLTRKQQGKDKQLRTEPKRLREQGEVTAKIKYGKIIKNGTGRREVVLYQLDQHI